MGKINKEVFPPSPGIYKITCVNNGIIYIGSSNNLRKRKEDHSYRLRAGVHESSRMQHCYNKYGVDSMVYSIVELVSDLSILLEREQYYIDSLQVCNKKIGFNIAPIAGSCLGTKHSEETKQKQRDIKLKNPTRYWLGKNHSEETRLKISQIQIGRKASEETKALMRKTALENKLKGVKAFKYTTATILDPDGNLITIENIKEFCRNKTLSPSCLGRVISGERDQHKGYRKAPSI